MLISILHFNSLFWAKYGRVMITVPLTLGTVDNYRKALIYLWKLQNQRTAPCPNPAPNPRSDGPLDEAINAYGVRLVYEKASSGTTRNTLCNTRDTYDGKLQIHHSSRFCFLQKRERTNILYFLFASRQQACSHGYIHLAATTCP